MTTVAEMIGLSQGYVHDDHAQTQGWITPELWLQFLNVEYRQIYRRMIRDSAVDPAVSVETLTVPSENIPLAEAIVCVTRVDGNCQAVLRNTQQALGRLHVALSVEPGDAQGWSAQAAASGITVTLNPPPSDGEYRCYYVPKPKALVLTVADADTEQDAVELPSGYDDRLCLGAARRALIRARGASKALMDLIRETDEEISFASGSRLLTNQPKVKNTDWLNRGWAMRGQDGFVSVNDRRSWFWR